MASMEAALQQNPNGLEVIDYIDNVCFKGKLLYMNEFGEPVETPVPLGVKMEELLRAALGRRTKYLQAKLDPTTDSPAQTAWNRQFIFSNFRMQDDDMIAIFNEWRHDVTSWMRPCTLTTYNAHRENGKMNKAHKLGKQAFSSYQFNLSGCRFLLHVFCPPDLVTQAPLLLLVI